MADQKLTQLSAITSAGASDLIYIVNDPSGTPVSKKITVSDLLKYLSSGTNNVVSKFSRSSADIPSQ